jgi:hypothetical protein
MGFVNEYKAKALDCARKAHYASPGDTRRELIDLALAYTQWWRNRRQRRTDRAYCVNAHTLDALQSECIVAARFPK